ncbi:MAG: phage tail protein, partial [Sphingomicrobium sp.]
MADPRRLSPARELSDGDPCPQHRRDDPRRADRWRHRQPDRAEHRPAIVRAGTAQGPAARRPQRPDVDLRKRHPAHLRHHARGRIGGVGDRAGGGQRQPKRRQGAARGRHILLLGQFRGGAVGARGNQRRAHLGRRQIAARGGRRLQGAHRFPLLPGQRGPAGRPADRVGRGGGEHARLSRGHAGGVRGAGAGRFWQPHPVPDLRGDRRRGRSVARADPRRRQRRGDRRGGGAQTVKGYAAHGRSIRAAVEPLVEQFGIRLFDNGDVLATPSRAAPLVADEEDLGCGAGSERAARIERSQVPARSLPAVLTLQYYDPARDYQTGSMAAAAGGGGGPAEQVDFPAVLTAGAAKALVHGALARRWAERDKLTLRLPPAFLTLRPGELVALPDGA